MVLFYAELSPPSVHQSVDERAVGRPPAPPAPTRPTPPWLLAKCPWLADQVAMERTAPALFFVPSEKLDKAQEVKVKIQQKEDKIRRTYNSLLQQKREEFSRLENLTVVQGPPPVRSLLCTRCCDTGVSLVREQAIARGKRNLILWGWGREEEEELPLCGAGPAPA